MSVTTDYVQVATTTHAYSGGGTGANSIDGDFGTSQDNQTVTSGANSISITLISTHTFLIARTIGQFKFSLSGTAKSDNYSSSYFKSVALYCQYYDTSWKDAYTSSGNSRSSGDYTLASGVKTVTGKWTSVTEVRLKVVVTSASDHNQDVQGLLYEIQAWSKANQSFTGVI